MQKKLEYYILQTDSIDNFNIQEALETLNRIIDDFKILEKSEGKFPKEFRQQYVKRSQEGKFF
jgi:aspartate carbamoyltransferase regulatory subunit